MSTTLPTRMGLAAPSLAEASRGLPSVKRVLPSTDDRLVTSVASAAPIDEPVSPELALVDPELAARLRALLPEIELQIPLELGPPPRTLRVLPDPEPDNVLALRPPPELVDGVEIVPAPIGPVLPPPLFPSRIERWRSLAKAFAAGAAVATFVTVGVVAKLGEGPAGQSTDPVTVPPRTAPAAPGASTGGAAPSAQKKTTPPATRSRPAATGAAGAARGASSKKTTPPERAVVPAKAASSGQAAASGQAAVSGQAAAPKAAAPATAPKSTPAAGAAQAQAAKRAQAKPAAKAATPASEPKRFAWAPVDGAVAYRVELFRGTKQVLEVRTKDPVYELVSPWRHAGSTERLTSGAYRWYVWPVFGSGPGAQAVVQADLVVP
jgi:hypothetical protein